MPSGPGWPAGAGEMARLLRETDWSTTPLGPSGAWSSRLAAMVEHMLATPQPSSLVCGPSLILLYNDAAAPLYGARHPAALGRPLPEVCPEGWAVVEPFYRRAFAGESITVTAQSLDLRGEGGRDDVFDAVLVPVREDGRVAHVHMVGFEVGTRARAEAALRESEELRRIALESGRMGAWRWDARTGLCRADAALLAFWGLPANEAWFPVSELFDRLDPAAAAEIGQARTGAKVPGQEFDGLVRIASGPTAGRWLRWRSRTDPDHPWIVNGVTFDVTDQKAAEERAERHRAHQAFLLALSDALRPVDDPLAVQETAQRMLGQHLGASRVGYAEDMGDGERVRMAREWTDGAPHIAGIYRYADYGHELVESLRAGRTCIRPDIPADPVMTAAEKAAHATLGLAATVNVPLVKKGRLEAILAVHFDRPHAFETDEVDLIEQVAERTWAAVARARTEVRLRESQERFRMIVEGATDYAILTTDPDGRIDGWMPGAQAVFGWTAAEALGRDIAMTFTPADVADGVPGQERDEASRQDSTPDVRWHMRKDGTPTFIEGHVRALRDETGRIGGFLKIGQDMTGRRRTLEKLEESEARFRQFGEASSDIIWVRDADSLAWEYLSPSFATTYGQDRETALAGDTLATWQAPIVPEDREPALVALDRVRQGERVTLEYRITRAADEAPRWIRDTVFPLRDVEGRVVRIGGIGRDITEEKETADRLQVLVSELQHRTRNLMAVIRSMADRTLATSRSLEDFRPRFRDRLAALTRANSLLSRLTEGERVTFDALLEGELSGHGVLDGSHGSQVVLEGPRGVTLRSRTVQTLALALHELATNAIKHGALSQLGGRLCVRWAVTTGPGGARDLAVDWTESGITVQVPPEGKLGYGRELIERALPYQLDTQVAYDLGPDGLRCRITLPLTSRQPCSDVRATA